jgi:hypothetical protein
VDLVKKITKIYPLSQAGNPPKRNFVHMSGKPFNMVPSSGYRFTYSILPMFQVPPASSDGDTTVGLGRSAQLLRRSDEVRQLHVEGRFHRHAADAVEGYTGK